MSLIQATIRNTETKGQVNILRKKGEVPGIIYGGENANQKISLTKKEVKSLIDKENFWTPLEKAISSLKLKASYGKLGNQNVGVNTFRQLIGMGRTSWLFDGEQGNYARVSYASREPLGPKTMGERIFPEKPQGKKPKPWGKIKPTGGKIKTQFLIFIQ